MKIEISLPGIKPITLNHAHKITTRGKFPSKYKTKEYKQLESQVNSLLIKNKNLFTKFNKVYDETKHYITCDYKFYYPILTKKKTISKKSNDVTNCVKAIEDIVFKHLVCDDSQVISASETKIHSDQVRTDIIINLHDLKMIL